MPKAIYATCFTGNNLQSCSVPVLSGLYGGIDDCLLAAFACLTGYSNYPFIIFSDAVNTSVKGEPFNGTKLAAFVNDKKFGECIQGPQGRGVHGTPVTVWIWALDQGQKDAFYAYMRGRETELIAKYEKPQ
jgi:hypothetical protein